MRVHSTHGILPLMLALLFTACGAEVEPAQNVGVQSVDTTSAIKLDSPAESAIYYAEEDVYLLSNFGSGGPATVDNDGFISRVNAETGEVTDLQWIQGTLSAPKGMAIVGDTLYVADYDAIEMYDLANDGAALGQIAIDTSRISFPNDVCAGPGGDVYVTDTGFGADFSASGKDGVYRIEGEELVEVATGAETLKNPNGCWVDDEGLLVVTSGSNEVLRVSEGSVTTVATLPTGSLDGLVEHGGTYYVTSWESGSVYSFNLDGESQVAVEATPSPADLGVDTERNRLIIPLLQLDAEPPYEVRIEGLE